MKRQLMLAGLLASLLTLASACSATHPDTSLTAAAARGDAFAVRQLLASGADANAQDSHGYNALDYAARAGHTETVAALLDAGANPNARDCGTNGWTPLLHAIHKNQTAVAKLLVERGADVNARGGSCREKLVEHGLTALQYAAGYDNAELVRLLLARGADPYDGNVLANAVGGAWDIDRPTADKCPTETVRALFEHAPHLSLSYDTADRYALWSAKRRGCAEVVALIEQHHADARGFFISDGRYKIKVTPDGWFDSDSLEEHGRLALLKTSSLFGDANEVRIDHGQLSVNGKGYGALDEGAFVHVNYDKVFINDREASAAGAVASR